MDSALVPRRVWAFEADIRTGTVRGLRLAAGVGATFVPMFYFLDRLLVPELAGTFLQWRLAASVTCVLCILASYTERGRAHIVAVSYVACLSVSLSVAAMVVKIAPGVSTYYAGLNLCLLSTAVLFPWHPRHTAAVGAVVVAAFVVPAIVWRPADLGPFANNLFFLETTAAIGTLSSYAHYNEHRRRFDLSWSLEQRSADLAGANERLRQVDELKSRFFANVSHELRTPLTLAISPVEALLHAPGLPPAVQATLRSLHIDLLALRRRIEDLIDLARLDSGRLQIPERPVSFARITQDVLAAARPFAERAGVTLRADVEEGLPAVIGDGGVLEQVVFNLVSNALKFTPAGGSVTVTLHALLGSAVLRVTDTGKGIPSDHLGDLFTRFGATTSSPSARGSGLGLALVKEFVQLHRGTVEVRSTVGAGTTFEVHLPLAPDGTLEEGSDTASGVGALDFESELTLRDDDVLDMPGADERPLVLVVDDNPRLRKLVGSALADEFRVAEARDGRDALDRVRGSMPRVVVADVMMPVMGGRELLASLRNDPALRHIPVLLLTAHAHADVRDEALEMGASDFLSKPFSTRELLARVRNFVALRSAQLALSATNDALGRALDDTRQAQARAVRAEKLAAVGQLASGIAHEVKNPINYLLNFARPARARLDRIQGALAEDAEPGLRRELEGIGEALVRVVEGGDRILRIVNGLQAFARGGQARVPVAVDTEVAAALRLVEANQSGGVPLDVDLQSTGTVLGSPVSVGAVTLNLVTNALHAIAAGGRVRVRTYSDDDAVHLVVEDDGHGIPPELLERIWDPFFTTRGAGEGLGLGLALVHRIVHENTGGRIDVKSQPGRGTRFEVVVPRAAMDRPESGWSDLSRAGVRLS
jgi:signal transduction histidine kinase